MNKTSRVLIIAATVCALPFFAGAATVEELTAQLQSLVAQLNALQQQAGGTVAPQYGYTSTPQSSTCPEFTRSVYLGISGDDVLRLQLFLIDRDFLVADMVTGYFGANTERAVQRFQVSQGLFSAGSDGAAGYGVVGPRTRAALAFVCRTTTSVQTPTQSSCPVAPPPTTICSTGWRAKTDSYGCTLSYECATPLSSNPLNPSACTAIALACPYGTHDQVGANCSHTCVSDTQTSSGAFAASPASGPTPLSVTFTVPSGNSQVFLDFGDGTSAYSVYASSYASYVQHTYSSTGTYTAKLIRNTSSCVASGGNTLTTYCSLNPQDIIAATTITVGGSGSGTFSAYPSSGSAPLSVNFSGTVWSAGYSVDFGDGTTSGDIGCGHGGCPATSVSTNVNVNHTYTSTGTYTAKLRQHFSSNAGNCAGTDCNVIATVTVSVGNTSSPTLSASPTSGAAPLAVTFSVPSTPEQNKKLYFGDGTSDLTGCSSTAGWTVTHTYAAVGTYYPYLATPCTTSGTTYSLGNATITVGQTSATPVTSVSVSPASVKRGAAQQTNGESLTISWSSQNAPSGSAIAFWLVRTDGLNYGLIRRNQSVTGSYGWPVPGSRCDANGACMYLTDNPSAYYTDLGTYMVIAKLYTPADAYLGGYPPATVVYPTFLSTATSSVFTVTNP